MDREKTANKPIEQTYEDINANFDGEWVLVRVTKYDDTYGNYPIAGIVVAHDENEDKVVSKLSPIKKEGDTKDKFALFRARQTVGQSGGLPLGTPQ